jgi:uncharacterized membrane protein
VEEKLRGRSSAERLGVVPIDAPPFPWTEAVVSVGALYMTVLVLSTQTRENQLSNLREQLTLDLAILSEQKTAKTIELLEELRRDSSAIPNRIDAEAEAMALPANPDSVLVAIRKSHAEAEREDSMAKMLKRPTTVDAGPAKIQDLP